MMITLPFLYLTTNDEGETIIAAHADLSSTQEKELNRLNASLETAVQAAVAAGTAVCLDTIGQKEAGWFKDTSSLYTEGMRRTLANYLLSERTFRQDQFKSARDRANERRYVAATSYLSVFAAIAVAAVLTTLLSA